MSEVRKLGSSKSMNFATFQSFEVFRLLTILSLFDDFLTNWPPPPPSSTPSCSTTTGAARVDEFVDELVQSIGVSGAVIFYLGMERR